MYDITLLLYDTVTVSVQFSHDFSTKCICYNMMCIGTHQIQYRYSSFCNQYTLYRKHD